MNKRPSNLSTLKTDKYAFTMLEAAIASGAAEKKAVFEVFTRSLPWDRTFGVVSGIERVLDEIVKFQFDDFTLDYLQSFLNEDTIDYLAKFSFSGNISGYQEGGLLFANSPILTVETTFGEGILLETLILSILNHDCAVASAAAHIKKAAGNKKLFELGSRRTHEDSAVAASRSAYLGGFDGTSNVLAAKTYNIPLFGSTAHAFVLAHETEEQAFEAQINAFGTETTLLVDTYDITEAIDLAIRVAGKDLYAIRIDSGDPHEVIPAARQQLDDLEAWGTNIVYSGDLNQQIIEEIEKADLPVDAYGIGTDVVLGGGHPTMGFVYKLVAVEDTNLPYPHMRSVAKKSSSKKTVGGKKTAYREFDDNWTVQKENLVLEGYTKISPDWISLQELYLAWSKPHQFPSLEEARNLLLTSLRGTPKQHIKTEILGTDSTITGKTTDTVRETLRGEQQND